MRPLMVQVRLVNSKVTRVDIRLCLSSKIRFGCQKEIPKPLESLESVLGLGPISYILVPKISSKSQMEFIGRFTQFKLAMA